MPKEMYEAFGGKQNYLKWVYKKNRRRAQEVKTHKEMMTPGEKESLQKYIDEKKAAKRSAVADKARMKRTPKPPAKKDYTNYMDEFFPKPKKTGSIGKAVKKVAKKGLKVLGPVGALASVPTVGKASDVVKRDPSPGSLKLREREMKAMKKRKRKPQTINEWGTKDMKPKYDSEGMEY